MKKIMMVLVDQDTGELVITSKTGTELARRRVANMTTQAHISSAIDAVVAALHALSAEGYDRATDTLPGGVRGSV